MSSVDAAEVPGPVETDDYFVGLDLVAVYLRLEGVDVVLPYEDEDFDDPERARLMKQGFCIPVIHLCGLMLSPSELMSWCEWLSSSFSSGGVPVRPSINKFFLMTCDGFRELAGSPDSDPTVVACYRSYMENVDWWCLSSGGFPAYFSPSHTCESDGYSTFVVVSRCGGLTPSRMVWCPGRLEEHNGDSPGSGLVIRPTGLSSSTPDYSWSSMRYMRHVRCVRASTSTGTNSSVLPMSPPRIIRFSDLPRLPLLLGDGDGDEVGSASTTVSPTSL